MGESELVSERVSEREIKPGHTSGSRGNRTYAHVSCKGQQEELRIQ